jgi:predicted dehydrogenase
MDTKIYRAALVGLGNIAWRFNKMSQISNPVLTHAAAFARNDRTALVGGCSPNEEDCRNFEATYGLPAFNSLEDLIKNLSPDVLSICSPPEFHFEQVFCAVDKKISMIWLEKPPAVTLKQVDTLIKQTKNMGDKAKVLVNYQRRYMEPYIKLKSFYDTEIMGKCPIIQATYSRGLEANGSHILDMIFHIVGEERQFTLNLSSTHLDDQNPSFTINFEGGPHVFVMGCDLTYHNVDISLTCTKGRMSVLYGGMKMMIEEKVEHEYYPGFFRLKAADENALGYEGFGPSMEAPLQDLINSFENKQLPKSNLVTARPTMAVIEQIKSLQ